MSLRCQNLDCTRWIEYECSCPRKFKLCEYHFRLHGEMSGCYGNSKTHDVNFQLSVLKLALSKLQEAKLEVLYIVNQMVSQLEFLSRQFIGVIKQKQKIVKHMLTKGIEGNIDEVLGQFRYVSYKKKELEGFTDLARDLFNKHFSIDTGEDKRLKEISFQDEVICIC